MKIGSIEDQVGDELLEVLMKIFAVILDIFEFRDDGLTHKFQIISQRY